MEEQQQPEEYSAPSTATSQATSLPQPPGSATLNTSSSMALIPEIIDVEFVDVDTIPIDSMYDFTNTLPPNESAKWKSRIAQLHRELIAAVDSQHNQFSEAETLRHKLMENIQQQQRANKDNPQALEEQLGQARNQLSELYRRETERKQLFQQLAKERDRLHDEIDEIATSNKDYLITQLSSQLNDLKMELVQGRGLIDNLTKDADERKKRMAGLEQHLTGLEAEQKKTEQVLTKTAEIPTRMRIQSDQFSMLLTQLNQDIANLTESHDKLQNEYGKCSIKRSTLEDTLALMKTEYDRLKLCINQVERDIEHINKERDISRERMQIQREERIHLDSSLKSSVLERRVVNQTLNRVLHEKDALLKEHRRAEMVLNNAKADMPSLKKQTNETLVDLNNSKREMEKIKDKIGDQKKEIDLFIYDYLQSEQISARDRMLLEDSIRDIEEYEKQLHVLSEQTRDLRKQSERLTIERQMKSRDLMRYKQRVRKTDEENKIKDFFVDDLTKTFQALVEKSRNLHELYEVIKKEKNKYATLIQFAKQRVLEANEKSHILQSEIEILRSQSLVKSRDLLKQTQELANMNSSRNAVRSEINKITASYRQRKDHVEQHLSQIEILQSKVDNREWLMSKHRREYEVALQQRNHTAQQLLERNDELCVLYQRQSLQDKTLLRAEEELRERDSDIKRCQLEINSAKRDIIMLRDTNILLVKNRDEFERMWQEFTKLRVYEHELMQYFHDPMNAKGEYSDRINMMAAQDPSQDALKDKVAAVTQEITNADEVLLSKKMILTRLEAEIKEANEKIRTARKEHLPSYEELDHLTKRITKIDRDLMSHISELSMVQAKAIDLQQQKQELEERLQEGPARQEAEHEWRRYEKRQRRMQQFEQNQKRQIAELMHRLGLNVIAGQQPDKIDLVGKRFLFKMDDGRYTEAVQRPDAYIPQITDGPAKTLAIPKPYGSLAPFKPSEESHNMQRYVRVPVEKPIEY